MTPDPHPWGWDPPARALLLIVAGIASVSLLWISGGGPPEPVEVPAFNLDANSAPAPVLEVLPGIGPVLAGRMIEARTAKPFESIEDVDRRVKGIGPVKSAALRPFLRFDPVPASKP